MRTLAHNTPTITDFTPTNAIFVNAKDVKGKMRGLTLLFNNTDNWLGMETPCYIDEELQARLNRLMHEDKTVVAFQNKSYALRNGIYTLSWQTVPVYK